MARTKMDPKERKDRMVFVLLTPDERKKLDRLARRPHYSRSRILREAFREWLAREEAADSPAS